MSIEPGATTVWNATTTMFKYSTIDIAGQQDATPANYTVNWSMILPVKLLSFSVVSTSNCQVRLFWESADEKDFQHYTIEQSGNGRTFNFVARVAANNGGHNTYTYNLSAKEGGTYYRLQMVNKDGTICYSNATYIKSNCKQAFAISISPNPASSSIVLSGVITKDKVMICDATGRTVVSRTVQTDSAMPINISNLQSGFYYVNVVRSGTISTIKLLKK